MEAHEMWRGMDVYLEALRLQHGAGEGARAALAIGAGDMDHRRQFQVRITKVSQEPEDSVQCQVDPFGMQRQQALEHRVAARGFRQHSGPFNNQEVAVTPPLPGPGRRGMDKTLLRGFSCFISMYSTLDRVVRISFLWVTMSSMPCSSRYSARWKPSGSFSRMVWAMTRAPVKPIWAPGSAICMSPSMA